MNIGLLSILHNKIWDFRKDMAQTYADALRNAIELQLDNDLEKQHGYFLSKKGYKDKETGKTVGANFEDKLYVGNIHRIESHLYWNDEELQDDDQIINVVVVDGPITRDGGGCSYGSKDWRDQVLYANTIPQVVGHLFLINTPGGEAASRNDYEMMINDCREKGKPTVAFVDGMCCSSGVNLACRLDRVIVMNPRDDFGCIGTMAAFWAVAHDTVDQDGYRYVELVGKDCPEKNAWYREAAKGDYEKLQAELDRDTEEFHRTVRENRPLVEDRMLTGEVFEAQQVRPALVDGIGDMERAIECVFQLADETMTAARFMTADPDGEGGEGGEPEPGKEPDELAKLNAQQKAAINKEKGNLTVVDDGHVTAERQGMFGPHMEEIATPKKDTEMTDEEKKAAEAEAAKAAEKNDEAAQAEGQQAEGQAAGEGAGEGAQEGAGEGSQEGAGEGAQEGAQEGTGEGTGEGEGEGSGEGNGAGEGEGTGEGAGEGEGSGEGSEDQNSEKSIEDAQAEIDKITETLHGAEQMIADKDKVIEEMQSTIETKTEAFDTLQKSFDEQSKTLADSQALVAERDKAIEANTKTIAEKDALIEKLNRQVADLKAEVKELSGKETPMVDGQAGVPDGNGTGEAPKQKASRIQRGMSYRQIREAMKDDR